MNKRMNTIHENNYPYTIFVTQLIDRLLLAIEAKPAARKLRRDGYRNCFMGGLSPILNLFYCNTDLVNVEIRKKSLMI
jgi:hypothetical protein